MLILHEKHPAHDVLPPGTTCLPGEVSADIGRVYRLGVLNLMPKMRETELDLLRCFQTTPLWLEPVWIRIASRQRSGNHTPPEYVEMFYQTLEEAKTKGQLDGMIITGAPIEELSFKEVTYWEEMCEIMDYVRGHVPVTLHLCWAAMASAYHYFGVEKKNYKRKLAGVFPLTNVHEDSNPFSRGMNPVVRICQSRHTGVDEDALDRLAKEGKLALLFRSQEPARALDGERVGATIFASADGSQLFNLGHFEYHANTIEQEVLRDLGKTPPVTYPVENYFEDEENHSGIPEVMWKSDGVLFFSNFLNVMVQRSR